VTPKLLLADDSVTIQRVIELTFADEDVQVFAVGDGQQAIDRVRADPPDIVLADVGMPERDGYEVAAFIKGDPKLAHIPVLLLTGAFEPVDEVRARAVGCDGVLVKPFEPQMVISRVRDLLAGHRAAEPFGSVPLVPSGEMPAHSATTDPGAPSAFEAAAGSLEDYFDRLDAALANKNASGSAAQGAEPASSPSEAPAVTAAEPPRIKVSTVDELDLTDWDPARTSSAEAAKSAYTAAEGTRMPIVTAPGAAQSSPSPRAADAAPVPPEPAAASPAPTAVSDAQEASLQEAFTALLRAEQHVADVPAVPPAVTLSSDAIEEIVRRVIARMGDDSMRAAVLDAAERLVRDEIARIKSQS